MRQAVLDTDILSYITDQRYPEVSARARQYYRVFRFFTVSAITIAEVVEGLARIRDHRGIEAFLKGAEGFEILPVDLEEAVIAGQIIAALAIAGQKIGEQDPFIAAVAIANGRPLVTNNTGHYQRIIDLGFPLEIENWRES
jgi:predicted nucleic acid-binding protein